MIRQNFNDGWIFRKGSGGSLAALLLGESDTGERVRLPHDASVFLKRNPEDQMGNGNGYYQEICCHYTKEFEICNPENKTVWLEFDGVYQNAFVYVNQAFAGKCPYGYSRFFIDATRFLKKDEKNKVTVVVKNGLASGRWYTGSGIYRDVNLLIGERLHLMPMGVHLYTVSSDAEIACIQVESRIRYTGIGKRNVRLNAVLKDVDGKIAAQSCIPVFVEENYEQTHRLMLYVRKPQHWDVDHPYLYTWHVQIENEQEEVIDKEEGRFGIRTLQVDPCNGLCINGRPIKLRGGCIHHDHGIIGAMQFPYAEKERIRKLKNAGYNAIRSAHYPASKYLLDICDEMGILVMDEYTDVWTTTKVDYDYGLVMLEWWEKDIRSMVDKDFNHPCVIMYSIGNEIGETGNPFDCKTGKKIADLLKQLDPGRFTINCINPMLSVKYRIPEILEDLRKNDSDETDQIQNLLGEGEKEINSLMSDLGSLMHVVVGSQITGEAIEEAASHVDILGYNYAAARYEKDIKDYPNRLMLGSETYSGDLDANWELVKKYPQILGDFSWTAWDYLGEAGIGQISYGEEKLEGLYGGYPYRSADCGEFNLIGDRMPVSYWREILWGLSEKPYIAVCPPRHYGQERHLSNWRMTDAVRCWNWEGFEEKPVRIEVYSDAQEVHLYQDGKIVGKKETGKEKKGITVFDITYHPGKLTAIAVTDDKEIERDELRSTVGTLHLKAVCERTQIPFDGSDICYIEFWAEDEQGTRASHLTDKISICLEGEGEIIGFGSADPKATENFFDRTIRFYEGRARAAVRGNGIPGMIIVTACTENIGSVSVALQAQ